VSELRVIADEFGVDHSDIKTKAELINRLEEEGVTDETFQAFSDAEVEIPELEEVPAATKSSEETVLIYMKRANPTYEILGYKFSSSNPYVAMSASDAEELISLDERGFRRAEPKEVAGYYS
jgi:hypothetical protein